MTGQELLNILQKMTPEQRQSKVMFLDPNSKGGPFSVTIVSNCTAVEGQFPADWNMPKGFKYILLEN